MAAPRLAPATQPKMKNVIIMRIEALSVRVGRNCLEYDEGVRPFDACHFSGHRQATVTTDKHGAAHAPAA